MARPSSLPNAPADPFQPATLGPVTLRNRIIKAATSEGRSPDGLVTDDLIEFHRRFAVGGVGMTTVAYCTVAEDAASAPGQINMSRAAIPGLRKLADAVHEAGAAVSAQLGHAGVVGGRRVNKVTPLAPSRFVNPQSFDYCRPITRAEIQNVVEQFGDAAQVAVDAGFDAVELHLGHLYLPSSFLSPAMNRRKDEYGGSIENRARFCRQIAQHVRDVVEDKIAVIAKLSMEDGLRGGISIPESLRVVQLLDADRNLDAIELTQGSSVFKPMYLFRGDTPVDEFAAAMKPPINLALRVMGKWALGSYPYRDQYMLESARQFLPVVAHTPLILLGGVTAHQHIVDAVDEGFSYVAIGRALLREPDLINQMAENPEKRSLCNHNNKCMVTVFGRTHCVLDPEQRYGDVGDDLFRSRRLLLQQVDTA